MALAPPVGSMTPGIKWLIVDSSPLLTSPLASLRGMAEQYLVTPDVVAELRDTKGREVMREAELYLLPAEGSGARGGFTVREPTAEAIAKITAFARKTGDLGVLSQADIRVLALCLTLELEENGSWRVRDTPGQVLTGPPAKEGGDNKKAEVEGVTAGVAALSVEGDSPAPVASTSAAAEAEPAPAAEEEEQEDGQTQASEDAAHDGEEGDVSDAESDSSGGSWITPDNVNSHKVKDLGLFTPPTDADGNGKVRRSTMKAAVLTGDFAMQNVGLQMGLNVLGSGGKRVREVRTWVLRCHGCFKICKDVEKRFCPSCGNPTLLRTSITYVPATAENPKGYILHLKANFQYRNRGTRYSLPTPKMGKAGGQQSEPVLREDQKEWTRGVRTQEVMRSKETRAILRSVLDDKKHGRGASSSSSAGGPMPGWDSRDWVAPMDLGEKGRGKRAPKNGAKGEVRLDKSGLPVIGAGRRNPNESRRKH